MSIKLKAIEIFPIYLDMFTPGRIYYAEHVYQNGNAVFIASNKGHTNIVDGYSVYGKFEVINE